MLLKPGVSGHTVVCRGVQCSEAVCSGVRPQQRAEQWATLQRFSGIKWCKAVQSGVQQCGEGCH